MALKDWKENASLTAYQRMRMKRKTKACDSKWQTVNLAFFFLSSICDGYCDLNFRRMKTLLNALSTSKDETYDGPKTGRGAVQQAKTGRGAGKITE
jgi:hypothetical protein